jgi:hypothetical protein
MTSLTAAPSGLADSLAARAAAAGLTVLAAAAWPESEVDKEPPGLAGFIVSSFSPLVAAVADRCLRRRYSEPPIAPERGERIALILVSPLGDVAAAVHVAHAVDTRGRVGPLLFFQSVPNSVAGHITAHWGVAGPVVCLSSATAGPEEAALLFDDGGADEALVIVAEQTFTDDGTGDRAAAVFVRRGDESGSRGPRSASKGKSA